MDKRYYNSHILKNYNKSYENGEYELSYYVISSDICKIVGKKEKIYGIEIVKKYTDTSGNCISQTFTKDSITSQKCEIFEIIKLLYDKKTADIM